ncbi:ankyrin [Polychaeton citri CBS 116435]|uniref:Ankyrin n=1 Tax=Polychaeton citri CBS 116435 TaxID=1314669 RepID=A0A9P4QEV6_9PEZI|nr:ankyrin [Polychaeton citri CBS 116435]
MDGQPHESNPKDPSQLPLEALDLATKLFNHAREGKTNELKQYITAGIPVNLTNHKGDTLLMLAAYYGNLDTVKMLIDHDADLNALNERGQSPIAGAVFKGYDEIVGFMHAKGADLLAGQPNAIDSAKMFRREELLRMFGVENDGIVG